MQYALFPIDLLKQQQQQQQQQQQHSTFYMFSCKIMKLVSINKRSLLFQSLTSFLVTFQV